MVLVEPVKAVKVVELVKVVKALVLANEVCLLVLSNYAVIFVLAMVWAQRSAKCPHYQQTRWFAHPNHSLLNGGKQIEKNV